MRKRKEKRGNVKAMRDALGEAYNILEKIQSFTPHISDVSLMREFSHRVCRAKHVIDTALFAPPRNCDVGTEEEQIERFELWCVFDKPSCCKECEKCFARWAQMPYKEGGAK